MTAVPRPADPTVAFSCVYDAWNRLTEVRAGQVVMAEYRYDGVYRRIVEIVPHTVDEETHWHRADVYFTAGWQAVEERFADDLAAGQKGAVASAVKVQGVWSARYIDSPVCRDRDADGGGHERFNIYMLFPCRGGESPGDRVGFLPISIVIPDCQRTTDRTCG